MLFKKPIIYKILSRTCTGINDLHLQSITFIPHSNPKDDFTTLFSMKGADKMWTQLFSISTPMLVVSSPFCHTQLTSRAGKAFRQDVLAKTQFGQDIYKTREYSRLTLFLTSAYKQFELKHSPQWLLLCFSLWGQSIQKRFWMRWGAKEDRVKVPNMGRERGWKSQEGLENWSTG